MGVKTGQLVIKGVKGEFYPCDPDVFAETYDDSPPTAPMSKPDAIVVVDVRAADLQPVADFIAKVARGDALLRRMSRDEAIALPDTATAGWTLIQEALRDLGKRRQAQTSHGDGQQSDD